MQMKKLAFEKLRKVVDCMKLTALTSAKDKKIDKKIKRKQERKREKGVKNE